MQRSLKLTDVVGPIRIKTAAGAPLRVAPSTGALSMRVLGRPGPEGAVGPAGPKGEPGADGITIIPTDAAINGGFF